MIITTHAYARAGLIGNPSDGYFGKTISISVRNFKTTVQLWETPQLEILPDRSDRVRFDSLREFVRDVRLHGYYGSMRLIKAAIKGFADYCARNGKTLDNRNFTISFSTDIPRLVGLSGSSAIVVAVIRALMQFYNVQIDKVLLPGLVLSIERDHLGIAAGLQDRVIQVYEGMVYMDFDQAYMEKNGHGIYEPMKPAKMPPLYIAYDPARAEVSDIPHRNLRALFTAGDPAVLTAMQRYRQITDTAKAAIESGDWDTLGRVMNENFDLRRTIMNIAPENLRMVETARSTGASAKFAGSGGAIIGLYKDGRHFQRLADAMAVIGSTTIRPIVFED